MAASSAFLADPTVGLHSNTYASKTGILNQLFNDGLIDIVVRRTPLSGMDDLIQKWWSSGGDQRRTESSRRTQPPRGPEVCGAQRERLTD